MNTLLVARHFLNVSLSELVLLAVEFISYFGSTERFFLFWDGNIFIKRVQALAFVSETLENKCVNGK